MAEDEENKTVFKLYTRRYYVLILFLICTLTNGYQWIQYTVIRDEVLLFYNESMPASKEGKSNAIESTSLVYMIAYLPLIFPATYILSKYGLRITTCIGAFLNALGAFIKCFSIKPNRFAVLMVGQVIVAIAQAFTLGNPPYIAAVWFSERHISFVTSLGVFGNQIGVALGFLVPSEVLSGVTDLKLMEYKFKTIIFPMAAIIIIDFILIVIVFKDKPKTPPNNAQFETMKGDKIQYVSSLKILMSDFNFLCLFLSYGTVTGVFYSISTNLDSYYNFYHPDIPRAPGHVGWIITISGLIGAIIAGIVMDNTKAFKLISALICAACFVLMLVFTFTLRFNVYISYVVSFLLGFFLTGFLPIGFEMAAEMTYPINEGVSSGMLNVSAQFFGIVITKIQSAMIDADKLLGSNIFLCVVLFIATISILCSKPKFKRFKAQNIPKLGCQTEIQTGNSNENF